MRDKPNYRASLAAEIRPRNPTSGDSPMTAAADPQIVPRQPAAAPALRAADQGVADALEAVLSDNTRRVYGAQWRIFTGWCDEVGSHISPRRTSHPGPILGRPGQCRRQHRHHAPRHQRHRQGPPVGRPGISLPGPWRARSAEGLGPAAGQAPAPGRRPHRRHPRRDPAHRSETPCPRPWHRDPRAGRRARQVRPGPGGPCCPMGGCGVPRRWR